MGRHCSCAPIEARQNEVGATPHFVSFGSMQAVVEKNKFGAGLATAD